MASATKEKSSNQNKQLRMESEKIRKKNYRLNLKNDPAAYQKHLDDEKKRREERAKSGKTKSINQLSPKSQSTKRRYNNEKQRNYREKRKLLQTEEQIDSESENNINRNVNDKSLSKQAIAGKKLQKKRKTRCYNFRSSPVYLVPNHSKKNFF